ncbi:hypothetical protein BDY19DRAFT_996952 [Irpex rosettiformis]|uniref:Uncharacterized protein n=1 Tax=Irpex rosettiformis TaxID=378272 RepID=A0ACB8TTB4_9APHY|nr:hypothetical protein BDY19DRAFT_996952 [Irpex rosettiformis]
MVKSKVAVNVDGGLRFNDSESGMLNIFNVVRAPDKYSGDVEKDLQNIQSIDIAVENVFGDVKRLLQDIIYLKRYRNSLTPSASLPAEILLMIFRLCPQKRTKAEDHCFGFSQVCHWWRTVAIAEPTLWTTPDIFRPNLAEVMCKSRSSDLPLHIHCPDVWDGNDFVKIPSAIGPRVESIDISYHEFDSIDSKDYQPAYIVHGFLHQNFPILQTLSLKYHHFDQYRCATILPE